MDGELEMTFIAVMMDSLYTLSASQNFSFDIWKNMSEFSVGAGEGEREGEESRVSFSLLEVGFYILAE